MSGGHGSIKIKYFAKGKEKSIHDYRVQICIKLMSCVYTDRFLDNIYQEILSVISIGKLTKKRAELAENQVFGLGSDRLPPTMVSFVLSGTTKRTNSLFHGISIPSDSCNVCANTQ